MKKLDTYIGIRFLTTVLVTFLLLILVSIAGDMTEKMDDILENNVPGKEVIKYIFNFIPYILSLLASLFVLISTIFFTSRLANRSEIIAMMNGGVNFYRLLVPYLVASTLIAVVFFFINHYSLPNSEKGRVKFDQVYVKKKTEQAHASNVHIQTAPDEFVYLRMYNNKTNNGHKFELDRFNGIDLVYNLKAQAVEYVDSTASWLLVNYVERSFNAENETFEEGSKKTIKVDLVPNDLYSQIEQRTTMTTPKLNKQITRLKAKGSDKVAYFQVEKHRRTALPVSIIILTVIGVSIASRKVRGGIGLHLAFGLVIGSVYWLSTHFAKTVAEGAGVPSEFTIWVPNIFFGIVALLLVLKAQK